MRLVLLTMVLTAATTVRVDAQRADSSITRELAPGVTYRRLVRTNARPAAKPG